MASSGASAEAARAVEAGSAGDRRRCVTPQCSSWRCAPRMLRAASQIAMSLAEPARSFGNPPSSLANDRGQALTIIMPGQPNQLSADNEHYVKFGPCRPGVTAPIGLVRRRFAVSRLTETGPGLTGSGPIRWFVSLNLARRPDDLVAVSLNLVRDWR